jgi:hypothetical protein
MGKTDTSVSMISLLKMFPSLQLFRLIFSYSFFFFFCLQDADVCGLERHMGDVVRLACLVSSTISGLVHYTATHNDALKEFGRLAGAIRILDKLIVFSSKNPVLVVSLVSVAAVSYKALTNELYRRNARRFNDRPRGPDENGTHAAADDEARRLGRIVAALHLGGLVTTAVVAVLCVTAAAVCEQHTARYAAQLQAEVAKEKLNVSDAQRFYNAYIRENLAGSISSVLVVNDTLLPQSVKVYHRKYGMAGASPASIATIPAGFDLVMHAGTLSFGGELLGGSGATVCVDRAASSGLRCSDVSAGQQITLSDFLTKM